MDSLISVILLFLFKKKLLSSKYNETKVQNYFMSVIDIFPKICKLFPGFTSNFIKFGFVVVNLYHMFCGNVILNTSFENQCNLEKISNTCLIPVHYLCAGKKITYNHSTQEYDSSLLFDYRENKLLNTPVALSLLPYSLILGGILKTLTCLIPEVKAKHKALKKQLNSTEIKPLLKYYRSIGLQINDFKKGDTLNSLKQKRRPGDENVLQADKDALRAIADILYEKQIPFWVDFGTLLGAYRYEGVIPWDNDLDIAILANDSQNVMQALNGLDPKKYIAQDWSSRVYPNSYIRVYVKKSHNHIDLYHVKIDEKSQMLSTIVSHEESHFMATDWKTREKMMISHCAYDRIFPLKKALFDGFEVPVPNHTAEVLNQKYGDNLNAVKIYSEETGQYEKDLSHPYWKIPLAH